MKYTEADKCYVCDADLENIGVPNELSQFVVVLGNGINQYSFEGIMRDEAGEEVTCCKQCVIKALVMSAQTLKEYHAVDKNKLN